MKRFLCMILTVAMLISGIPAVFAENDTNSIGAVTEQEVISDNQDEITKDNAEEISGEGEENSEEQISLMSEENNISLLGSESSEKMTGEVTKDNAAVRVDNIKDGFGTYYFDTLTNAVNAINSYPPSSSNTAEIQILKGNIELADILNVGNESTKVRVQIFANDNCTVKRADGFKGAFFNVAEGSTLTFGHTGTSHNGTLTLDGNKSVVTATAPLIVSGGTLIFNRNIILQNNLNQSDSPGAGVYIGKNGSFTMKDGCIENNSTSYLFGGIGGGVYAEGDVTIAGGTIQKNTRITTTGDEGETGNSIYFKSAKTLKITGGNLKCNFGSGDEDIILSSYSMTYIDEDNNKTFEYTNCILELSGSPSFNTLKPEIDKRHVIMKKDGSEVTLTVKPEIKITSALNIDSPITILGGWYCDWTVDPAITYTDIPVGTQLVTFADGLSASDYISKFQYEGEEARYFNVDEEGELSLSDTAAGYKVTVTDPTYRTPTAWDKAELGEIIVGGVNDLASVPVNTTLTLSIKDETVTDSISRQKHHSFSKWIVKTESGTEIEVNNNQFTMPNENVTVAAEYKLNPKFNFYTKEEYGTREYEMDVANWNENGNATYNILKPNKQATDEDSIIGTIEVSANGLRKRYLGTGGGYYSTTIEAPVESIVTVVANITDSNYSFNGIKSVTAGMSGRLSGTFNNKVDGNSNKATFIIPKGTVDDYRQDDQSVNIVFDISLNAFAINASATNGKINIANSANVNNKVEFTLQPQDETYELESYKVYKTGDESTTVSVTENGGKYSFTMPSYGVTVSATFVKKKHAVTITKEGEGTVSISPETPVEVGQTVTVTATPDEYWELSSLTMNGEDITSAKSFTMPNETVELKATFVKQKFSVTASATTNGTIELITESPINWGDNFTINVKADPHYEIDTVIVDGKTVTVDGQGDYTFEMPTHDVTVSATFKKVKYTITGTGDHATFSIPSSETYNWGDTVEFTVTPDKWYSVKSVYANDATVVITPVAGKENAYSFTMPQGNVIITAVTERPNFTVTFDSKGGSNITPKTVANGDAADKPGVPVWAGRGFAGWYTDESCTQKYDFATPVTENITLYARWFLWGDVNNDGTVDSYDALLIRRCRAGLTDYTLIENRLAGFVNGFENGRNYPDSGDAVSIRRFRAGLINRYKVEDGAAGYEFDLENDTYIPKN